MPLGTRLFGTLLKSNAVDLPQNAIARMETAPKWNPTAETILKLASALNCTPNDLLGTPS